MSDAKVYAYNATSTLWLPASTQVSGTTVGFAVAEMFAPGAEDNTNGVLATTRKLIAANTYAPSLYTNFGASTAAFAKASAGNVLALTGKNANGGVRFLQLHNKASAPLAAEVPIYSFPLPGATAAVPYIFQLGEEFFTGSGAYFSTGIAIAWSTTEATYTAATAGDHTLHLHYK